MQNKITVELDDNTKKAEKHKLDPEDTSQTHHADPIKQPCLDTDGFRLPPTVSNDPETVSTEELFNGIEISKLTKTQMKKYKKVLRWQASKKEKRAKERLKTKNKKIEAKMLNIDLGPSRKQLKNSKMADSSCKISIAIDLSFDDLMINKDMGKVIKQILRVYTMNRRSKAPMQLHLTSFNGKSKEEMSKHNGYENWDMHFHEKDYLDVFPKEKLVYLSSESNNIIKELEQDKVYIIGGLVDHNAHKGICYKKAVEQEIDHGQLPIAEYFDVKTRKVFTINQVFEILLGVSEGKTFKEAFEDVLPKRINMKPTLNESSESSSGTSALSNSSTPSPIPLLEQDPLCIDK